MEIIAPPTPPPHTCLQNKASKMWRKIQSLEAASGEVNLRQWKTALAHTQRDTVLQPGLSIVNQYKRHDLCKIMRTRRICETYNMLNQPYAKGILSSVYLLGWAGNATLEHRSKVALWSSVHC